MTMTESSDTEVQEAFHAVVAGDEPGVAGRLADMAELAERYRRQAENLALALDSNRQIGVAIGLIMAQYKLDHHAAYAELVRLSQDSNLKLRDVAAKLIAVEDPGYQPVVVAAAPTVGSVQRGG